MNWLNSNYRVRRTDKEYRNKMSREDTKEM